MVFTFFFLLVLLGPAGEAPAVQEWNILVLRADFPLEEPDEPSTTGTGAFDLRTFESALSGYLYPYDTPPHDRLYFDNHLEALARYYRIVSRGEVEIHFEVFPRGIDQVYTLPESALSYGRGRTPEEIGTKWVQLFRAAVELADADPAGPLFGDFNSFLVFHAGVGHETGALNDIRSVYLAPQDMAAFLQEPLVVDDGQFEITDGWILPEATSLRGQGGLNGLLAKFFGHQLGLPGLSNFADGRPAVGEWSLMDVGAHALGFVLVADSLQAVVGFVPSHPMAWSKARLGWIEPLEVRRDTTVSLVATDRDADLPKAVRIPITEKEYFLLENRQQRGTSGVPPGVRSPYQGSTIGWIGREQIEFSRSDGAGVWLGVEDYDAFVPGSGILIWHVDEARIEDGFAAGAINNDPVRQGIVLEEADGYRDIGNPAFARLIQIEGGPDDPFYQGGQTAFGPGTRPDSRSNAGHASGIHIEVLSEPEDTMRVEIRFTGEKPGWPLLVNGGSRLHGADVDGDGEVELLVEDGTGVQVNWTDMSKAPWRLEEVRLLASADANMDGRADIFVVRDKEVGAWEVESGEALWTSTLDAVPLNGLFFGTDLGLFPGRSILALSGTGLDLLDGNTGEVIRQESERLTGMTAADLDGDAALEVVGASMQGVWRLGATGLDLLQENQAGSLLPLVSGDLEGDGRAEIVLVEPTGELEVVAERNAGFKAVLRDATQGPVLGDIDGDGYLEIVVAGTSQVHAIRHNGIRQADFPARLARSDGIGRLEVSAVLLDLDGTGGQEIFLGTRKGVYGLDTRATLLPGFPLLTAEAVSFSPLGADLDGDGLLELAALTGEALYLWEPQEFSPVYQGRLAGWGQDGYSAARTYAHPGSGAAPEPAVGLLPEGKVYCYPNPVANGGSVHLRFFLNQPARIALEVYDAIGDRVEHLEKEEGLVAPAENEIGFSTSGYASGLYLCRLEARTASGQQEVVFVRMAVSQ